MHPDKVNQATETVQESFNHINRAKERGNRAREGKGERVQTNACKHAARYSYCMTLDHLNVLIASFHIMNRH